MVRPSPTAQLDPKHGSLVTYEDPLLGPLVT
jgi:hypothetical protein